MINQRIANYKTFTDKLKQTLGHDRFLIKFNRYQVKINTTNNKDYDKLIYIRLDNEKTHFHTFIKVENRHKKIVLKAATFMDTEDIITELDEPDIKVTEYVPLRGRYPDSRSYLVALPHKTQINDI